METETTLVRSDGTVELYAVTFVHLHIAVVIYPRYTEHDHALRLNQTLQQCFSAVLFFVCFNNRFQGLQDLSDSLMEFRFTWIFLNY